MQFINYFTLIRGLSCTLHRQQILLNGGSRLLRASRRNILTHPHKYHGPHLRTNLQTTLKNQQGQLFHQIRLESSHTSEEKPKNDQSNPASPGTAEPGDSDETTKYQALREELQQMRDLGRSVPEVISDVDLKYYTTLTSKSSRKKFLTFLFKRQALRKKQKLQKKQKWIERWKQEDEDEYPENTLPVNRIFRRISPGTMLASDNWKLASAMKFGPQIAFDFSFDENMVRPEVLSLVSQLTHVLNANKVAKDPFYMHWTGLKDDSMCLSEMQRMVPQNLQNLMVNLTERDVLEMFPREKLIYLTADSRNIMHSFDVDKVYIVGGLVDARKVQTGVTLGKAKRYNISHARFPLELYLQWEIGPKSLTLDQVARILHTLHETGDWMKALENVPQRKHGGFKVSSTMDSKFSKKIPNRQDLDRYYQTKKWDMELGQARKESLIKDGKRFAFSRAKREIKWELLPEEVAQKEEVDPTGDTLFSSSSELKTNPRRRAGRKGSAWFED